TRGVWKAPANVQILGVKPPLESAWMDGNTELNDSVNGKDINLIRHIAGKGTTVWGARTLAGNDLNWRYVPVKRLMMMLADTLKQATAYAVFEPNTANIWKGVETMCANFLDGLWRQGAFLGSKPADAYRVRVGLGQTMSADDVLNGIMRVEIAVAPVRPAEFVVLQFSHFIQPN
ncbi:MAG TPA: phage tail sheath C-terminal domain-containing protein, partial [Bacteroidia bacterium]|nr:phage tail sheath C-terminal domain-containing protein [Bacteroidia bacterium]